MTELQTAQLKALKEQKQQVVWITPQQRQPDCCVKSGSGTMKTVHYHGFPWLPQL